MGKRFQCQRSALVHTGHFDCFGGTHLAHPSNILHLGLEKTKLILGAETALVAVALECTNGALRVGTWIARCE